MGTVKVPLEARKGERTRAAILAAAASSFRVDGFDATTLASVADQLGITRSAVLHHFSSKAALLDQIVRPFVLALDDVMDRAEADTRRPTTARRRFVVELVDLAAEHRDAVVMLTRDVSIHPHLSDELRLGARVERFLHITRVAHDGHPLAAARSLAALGAVMRPLAAPDDVVDTTDPETRLVLVNAAMAAMKVPLPG